MKVYVFDKKGTSMRLIRKWVNALHIEDETKWPHFPEDIFKRIFVDENVWISTKIHWSS